MTSFCRHHPKPLLQHPLPLAMMMFGHPYQVVQAEDKLDYYRTQQSLQRRAQAMSLHTAASRKVVHTLLLGRAIDAGRSQEEPLFLPWVEAYMKVVVVGWDVQNSVAVSYQSNL